MFPVVFHPDYVIPALADHRFPIDKFRRYRDALLQGGLTTEAEIHAPAEAARDWLEMAHDPAYVTGVLDCRVPPEVERRIGFPMIPAVARRARLAVGGTLLAAGIALDRGLAFNAAGGSHHARREHGAGFCVFNDLAVAALMLRATGRARRILIIDLDVHQGDGTAAILADEPAIFTFSMHCGVNYPLRKEASDLDIALDAGVGDDAYLDALGQALPGVMTRHRPDFVFYLAGVDVHADDPLGRLMLSDAGLAARDRLVLDHCAGLPVAVVMGGGYDRDMERLAWRHATTARVAAEMGIGR